MGIASRRLFRLARGARTEDSFRGGVSVAAGFVSGSNGRADVVTAPGPGGGPLVRDFNGVSGRLAREWLAYDAGFRGGMSVAVGELTGDGQADIVTGAGAGGGPHVKVFDGATVSYGLFSDLPVLTVRQFSAYDPAFRGGVRVAAAELTGDAYAEILTAPGPGGGPYVKVFDGQTGGVVRQWLTGDAAFRGGLAVAGLAPVVPGEAVTRSFDFREGAQGWEHGFADVDATTASQYQSESGLLPLPAELGEGTGYMLQGPTSPMTCSCSSGGSWGRPMACGQFRRTECGSTSNSAPTLRATRQASADHPVREWCLKPEPGPRSRGPWRLMRESTDATIT